MSTPPAWGLLMSKIELVSHGLLTTRLTVVTGGGEIHRISSWVYWKRYLGSKWEQVSTATVSSKNGVFACFTWSALANKTIGILLSWQYLWRQSHLGIYIRRWVLRKEDIVKGFQTSWCYEMWLQIFFFPLPLWWFKIWFPQNVIAFLQQKTSE